MVHLKRLKHIEWQPRSQRHNVFYVKGLHRSHNWPLSPTRKRHYGPGNEVDRMAFAALFLEKNIANMSGMLFLLFAQSLFQFEVKERKWERYYGEKHYLDSSFNLNLNLNYNTRDTIAFCNFQHNSYQVISLRKWNKLTANQTLFQCRVSPAHLISQSDPVYIF